MERCIQSALGNMRDDPRDLGIPVKVQTLSSGIGDVTASDVGVAFNAGGSVFAFNARVPGEAKREAARSRVDILRHNLVYKFEDDIRQILYDLLPPVVSEELHGSCEVLKMFQLNDKAKTSIAGLRVHKGIIKQNHLFRVRRGAKDKLVHNGLKVESLRVVKDIVSSVGKGNECGIQLCNDDGKQVEILEGDKLEAYTLVEKRLSPPESA